MSDDLDARLRDRLQGSTSSGGADAGVVLKQLRPAMVRARRAHRVRMGTALCSVLVLFAGGAMALRAIAISQPEYSVSAGPGPDGGVGVDVDVTEPEGGSTGAPGITEPGVQTTAAGPESTLDATAHEAAGTVITGPSPSVAGSEATPAPTTEPGTTKVPTTTEATTTPETSEPTPTTVKTPSTTKAPKTTPPPQTGSRTIRTSCGTVTVSYDLVAETVGYLSAAPKAGYEVAVKDAGPETVEVELEPEGADPKCEIAARVDDGELEVHAPEAEGDGDESGDSGGD
jgi:hypothetical protein